MLVSVDVGYGYTKAVADTGRRAWFPSVVAQGPGFGRLASSIGVAGPGHEVTVRQADGTESRFLVGEAALLSNGVRSWDLTSSGRRDYGRLVLSALGVLGVAQPETADVDLALGLPLFAFFQADERRRLQQQLAGQRAWIQVGRDGGGYVHIRDVKVYAQAVGAYVTAAGDGASATQGPVGLIDVGYRTTDYLLLNLTPVGPVPDEARSGSADGGVGTAIEGVARSVSEETGVLVPDSMVESALGASGALMVKGRRYDVRDMMTRELEGLGARLVDQIRRAWDDRLDFLDALFVAGGGGQAMFPQLKALHPSATLLDDPIFANARGFLSLAQSERQA
ncbi:MAG: ParM/StbA family protein [Clostridia bacterium]|nr:ParM/StbA family protein [Clostridia bacterium]